MQQQTLQQQMPHQPVTGASSKLPATWRGSTRHKHTAAAASTTTPKLHPTPAPACCSDLSLSATLVQSSRSNSRRGHGPHAHQAQAQAGQAHGRSHPGGNPPKDSSQHGQESRQDALQLSCMRRVDHPRRRHPVAHGQVLPRPADCRQQGAGGADPYCGLRSKHSIHTPHHKATTRAVFSCCMSYVSRPLVSRQLDAPAVHPVHSVAVHRDALTCHSLHVCVHVRRVCLPASHD